jgi:hypothetical protein
LKLAPSDLNIPSFLLPHSFFVEFHFLRLKKHFDSKFKDVKKTRVRLRVRAPATNAPGRLTHPTVLKDPNILELLDTITCLARIT